MSHEQSPRSPVLYEALASWWPLVSPPEHYLDEADLYLDALTESCDGPARTLLELGSGGGNNASHLAGHFDELTLVDLSPEMLEVSRALNPDCEHVVGDMRDVRLGRLFDCVFVHDAVCYMLTEDDLRRAIATAFAHCRPGGAALFCPDYVRETFCSETTHGGEDDGERGLRYLEWSHDPDNGDTTYVVDYAFVLRDAGGATRVVHDQHVVGLFAQADWLRLLAEAGFEARALPLDLGDDAPEGHVVFACSRPR